MKAALFLFSACSLSVFLASTLGCEKTTVAGTGGRKLTLMKPSDQSITRGKSNDVKISIDRTKFEGPIAVELAQLPKGVQVTSGDKTIPRERDSVTFTLQAAPDADVVTNHRVTVTAKAAGDTATPTDLQATEMFLVTVKD